jgi:hypothetical protein
MKVGFSELNVRQIASAIEKIGDPSIIRILEEGMIPEADVLLCEYFGKRVNLIVDLAYRAEVAPVDTFAKDAVSKIEALILDNHFYS